VKKGYDLAKSEYEKALMKVASAKESKKIVVTKLYQLEKERAKTYQDYCKEVALMEIHIAEVDEKINYIFTELLVRWFAAQRNNIVKCYEELDHSKAYLLQLHHWCLEEEKVFEEQKQEREQLRKKVHQDFADSIKRRFVEHFQNDYIILACLDSNSDIQGNMIYNSLSSAMVAMISSYNIPLSSHLSNVNAPSSAGKSFENIQNYCRENFDSIGTKLLERNQTDLVIGFGDSLANLEKLQHMVL